MLKQGSHVIYGIHGVCAILGVETRKIDKKNVEYYVLEPVNQPGDRFYVPTHAEAKLKPVLTKSQIDALLKSPEANRDIWIQDENIRKQHFAELLNGTDRAALIAMVSTLRRQKEIQHSQGRKFHVCDENFLRDAEKLLSSEFALVLGIAPNAVGKYIQDVIED